MGEIVEYGKPAVLEVGSRGKGFGDPPVVGGLGFDSRKGRSPEEGGKAQSIGVAIAGLQFRAAACGSLTGVSDATLCDEEQGRLST